MRLSIVAILAALAVFSAGCELQIGDEETITTGENGDYIVQDGDGNTVEEIPPVEEEELESTNNVVEAMTPVDLQRTGGRQ